MTRPGAYGCPRLGTDARGSVHYYDDEHDRVIVIASDGEPERTQDLGGRPVTDWVDYVADRRGWRVNQLEDGLAGAVRAATEAPEA